ncbi:MAG: sugar phosphate nucleotidyltransferase [Patescibacteria group bacterium]
MNEPIAILLAGGSGTRFAPFVSDKIIWPFMGAPFVSCLLKSLIESKIKSIIVVTNNNNHEFFKCLNIQGVSVTCIPQGEDNGMSAALYSIRSQISGRPILVLNADDYVETNLIKSILSKIKKTNPKTLLVGLKRSEDLPVGYLKVQNEKVVSMVEKPPSGQRPSDLVKLTADYFSNSDDIFTHLDSTPKAPGSDSHYEDALIKLLAEKQADYLSYEGLWFKLKYPHYVIDVMELFQKVNIKSFVHRKAFIHKNAIIEDDVYIDEGARIEPGAIIKSGSYIGRNVIIGNNALVRQSFVEEGSVIGYGSEIARSYVGPKCQVHHSFVGDSVLEGGNNMSWGTVTANLRIDGKEVLLRHPNGTKVPSGRHKLGAMIGQNAFLGINCSTMPGVCIAASTKVMPGTIVKDTV